MAAFAVARRNCLGEGGRRASIRCEGGFFVEALRWYCALRARDTARFGPAVAGFRRAKGERRASIRWRERGRRYQRRRVWGGASLRLFVGIALCVPATLPGWGGGRSVSESQLLKLFEVCVFRKALLRFWLYGAPYLQLLAKGGGASLRLRPCKEVECSDAIDSDGD